MLYWHTVKYLRPAQITARIRFHRAQPKPNLAPPPRLSEGLGPWVAGARRAASLSGPGRFTFLSEAGSLVENGWDDPAKSKLWRYNQHYFDDLNAVNAEMRRDWHYQLLNDWLTANPPSRGSGWEPYPISLRIVNWVKFALSGGELSAEARHSLAIQARYLTQKIEWHLLGNHLFANAKALVFAGLLFEGDEPDSWFRLGRDILLKELPEQILDDGGQFELSPMYHALAIEDVLDLTNILRAVTRTGTEDLIAALKDCVLPMLDWLAAMTHPDDKIAFFNDAAFGIAPENSELRAYAQRLGFLTRPANRGLTFLKDSGYVRLSNGPAVIIADVAEVGPTYLPGHAHADTLSFECSVFGERLIVNSGTSMYGTGIERLRQRGTAAHSTVTIRDENSSEVWGGFRVARRAHILRRNCNWDGDAITVEAAHDGYARLVSGTEHTRTWRLLKNGLIIVDEVHPSQEARAIFHIHPEVLVKQETARTGSMVLGEGRVATWLSETDVEMSDGTWHSEFGKSIPNSHLIVSLISGRSQLEIRWT